LRRPSLRSQLNQIRLWVRQGRTDAWIAHKLDISVEQLRTFKREQGLDGGPEPAPSPPPADFGAPEFEPLDDADESPILEEIEPEGAEPEQEAADREQEAADREPEVGEAEPAEQPDSEPRRRRRRGRRGGRRRSGRPTADSFEATFDHGDEGYGLWFDPAVAENDVYSEHWAGHRAVFVTVEPDAITIRRVDENSDGEDDAG
jgi:hypothetical protein